MNLYHIKLTDDQKSALEHLFSLDIEWNKSELEKAWKELRIQVREAAQHVAIINALQDSGCNCNRKSPTKYDPCRKLRRGDRARVVERNGRTPICFPIGRIKVGDIVTVAENETGDVFIKVLTEDGHKMMAPWFMLELVTPVEEPYYIEETEYEYCLSRMVGERKDTPATYHKRMHPNAKAAAEAERDRLNEQYREEMGK